jgi:hypothetical protein
MNLEAGAVERLGAVARLQVIMASEQYQTGDHAAIEQG